MQAVDYKQFLFNFLQQTPHLPQQLLEEVSSFFDLTEIRKGTNVQEEGKTNNIYMLLVSGAMRSYVYDTEGNESTTELYIPGSLVLEPASFFLRIPAVENIEAVNDCVAWNISYEKINHLFHTYPQFREFGRGILVSAYASLKIRTIQMISKSAEARYELLIENKPEIFRHHSLKHIASYLGITDSSLSRIRKSSWKKHGD